MTQYMMLALKSQIFKIKCMYFYIFYILINIMTVMAVMDPYKRIGPTLWNQLQKYKFIWSILLDHNNYITVVCYKVYKFI